MQVSVETLSGLERKLTISVPTEKVEEEVSQRLKDLARKVKIDGFRPGKVPLTLVEKRFSDSVRQEVARDLVQSTLYEALKEKSLNPAGYPSVEPEQIESGKDFCYSAVVEVFPEIEVNELNQAEVEIVHAEVQDSDIEDMLTKLQEQHKKWNEVDRAVAKDDKVIIDFEGFLEGEAFAGGKATDHELIIGSGAMIPGFEDGIIGAEKGKEFEIKVTFPADYQHEQLAGKDTVFKILVKQVLAGELPALDDEFASLFNINDGGIEGLKKDIKENMKRELDRRLSSMNREKIFDKLLEKNPFDLPNALINQEIEHLKHEMYHRIFGHEHKENEKIPDFPRELFIEQATRRVHLGLLFSEYVKKHELMVDKARVDAKIEKLASAYENPQELHEWYQSNQENKGEIEALVMEELVAEKIMEGGQAVEKTISYNDAMNPKATEKDNKK